VVLDVITAGLIGVTYLGEVWGVWVVVRVARDREFVIR